MSGRIRWFGNEFLRELNAEQERRLARCAMVVERQAKRLLSVSGTGVRSSTGSVIRAVKRTRRTIYGAFPSRPGEPPRKQTGRLRGSVTWELVTTPRRAARVGTNVLYGRILQLFRDRPWLDRALNETSGAIRSILTARWNRP